MVLHLVNWNYSLHFFNLRRPAFAADAKEPELSRMNDSTDSSIHKNVRRYAQTVGCRSMLIWNFFSSFFLGAHDSDRSFKVPCSLNDIKRWVPPCSHIDKRNKIFHFIQFTDIFEFHMHLPALSYFLINWFWIFSKFSPYIDKTFFGACLNPVPSIWKFWRYTPFMMLGKHFH